VEKPSVKQGLPVEKKRLVFTATFISMLACSWVVGTRLLDVGKANPCFYVQEKEEVPPPPDVTPPTITISSPENNTVYDESNVSLTFNLHVVIPTLPELFYYYLGLSEVYYKASWLSNKTSLNIETARYYGTPERFSSESNYEKWWTYYAIRGYEFDHKFSIRLEGVPEGSHSLEVSAVLRGSCQTNVTYEPTGGLPVIHYGMYRVIGSSVVNFTVDTVAPKVSILTLENETYNTPDVMLNCTVNEAVSQVAYSLDGQDNMTISGNTTLADLSTGEHYITVYATDLAGHVGVSETIFFNVAEPFPTILVIAPIASVAVVGIGLLVYFRKRKH
jgi:hypothetical protein